MLSLSSPGQCRTKAQQFQISLIQDDSEGRFLQNKGASSSGPGISGVFPYPKQPSLSIVQDLSRPGTEILPLEQGCTNNPSKFGVIFGPAQLKGLADLGAD